MAQNIYALVLDLHDNVATLISDANKADTIILKGSSGSILLAGDIAIGHKVALTHIDAGEAIIKYGQKIGVATQSIQPGEWIHLHNMRSEVDITFNKRVDL